MKISCITCTSCVLEAHGARAGEEACELEHWDRSKLLWDDDLELQIYVDRDCPDFSERPFVAKTPHQPQPQLGTKTLRLCSKTA